MQGNESIFGFFDLEHGVTAEEMSAAECISSYHDHEDRPLVGRVLHVRFKDPFTVYKSWVPELVYVLGNERAC